MKILLPALLLMLLVSCTTKTLTVPKSINQNITANTPVSYKDNSISIVNFKAQQGIGTINLTFTTLVRKEYS